MADEVDRHMWVVSHLPHGYCHPVLGVPTRSSDTKRVCEVRELGTGDLAVEASEEIDLSVTGSRVMK